MSEEKAFKPTQRKLEKAKREGKVLKSRMFTTLLIQATLTVLLIWSICSIWVASKILLEYSFTNSSHDLQTTMIAALMYAKSFIFRAVGSAIIAASLGAILGELLQVGFAFETDVLAMKAERLNPFSGLKKIGTSIVQSWERLVGVILVATVGICALWNALPQFKKMQLNGSIAVVPLADSIVLKVVMELLAASLLIAGFDYLLRRRSFYRELSMSHVEMQDEQKHHEGSPLMKALRRSMHESIAMQDLERRIRQSKVLIVAKSEHSE